MWGPRPADDGPVAVHGPRPLSGRLPACYQQCWTNLAKPGRVPHFKLDSRTIPSAIHTLFIFATAHLFDGLNRVTQSQIESGHSALRLGSLSGW